MLTTSEANSLFQPFTAVMHDYKSMDTIGVTGFQLRFDNGYGISVMFGGWNQCATPASPSEGVVTSPTAEIAVLNPDGNLNDRLLGHALNLDRPDQVHGHTTMKEVLRVINFVSSL